MLDSYVKIEKGTPALFISGVRVCPMAYTTYFEERSAYKSFLEMGYRIFFVNVSLTELPINNNTAFSPFNVGVFANPKKPDYSELDDAARKILKECKMAVIFPRVYVSMPKWWVDQHPDDVVLTASGYRESLFSEAFRKDAEDMLLKLVNHVKKSDYEGRVGGWQLCGGFTQEWFHHDLNGSLTPAAQKPFADWVKENYNDEISELPSLNDYEYPGRLYQEKENAKRYSIFSNLAVAKTLDTLSSALKRAVGYTQVVGSFYGYATQSNGRPLFGTHGLRALLDSPNIDFFSSPNAYSENRAFGIDWADMLPVESIKLHGKLAFIECDIRTHLTCGVQEARPGKYPDDIYRLENGKSVWAGPPTEELSCYALRKCFAHQLTKRSAIWWFDMWGGWYESPKLIAELKKMKELYDQDIENASDNPQAEIVFFADEKGYSNLLQYSPQIFGIEQTRTAMGNIGAPYHTYLCDDAKKVISSYKAAVFPCPIPSDSALTAMRICDEFNVPYLSATAEHPSLDTDEIREFIHRAGAHIYTENNDVIYAGSGYVAIHSNIGGRKEIRLKQRMKVSYILGESPVYTASDTISVELKDNDTAIFKITKE